MGRPDGAGQQQIDRRGPRHAAKRRQHRRRQLLRVAEFTAHDLVFDLQPHHEEEQRHQGIVHPEVQLVADQVFTCPDRQRRVPQREIICRPR